MNFILTLAIDCEISMCILIICNRKKNMFIVVILYVNARSYIGVMLEYGEGTYDQDHNLFLVRPYYIAYCGLINQVNPF